MGLAAQRGESLLSEGFFGPGDVIASLEPVTDARLLQVLEPLDPSAFLPEPKPEPEPEPKTEPKPVKGKKK